MEKKDQIDAMFEVYGLSDGDRTPARTACLDRIVDKFDFDTEMYVYACQLSLSKPNAARIKYVENLLSYWKSKGIQTVQEVKVDIQKNSKGGNFQARKNQREIPTGTLQFRNFTERTNNNYMEKILKQYSQKPDKAVPYGTRVFRNFTEREDNNYMERFWKQYNQNPDEMHQKIGKNDD